MNYTHLRQDERYQIQCLHKDDHLSEGRVVKTAMRSPIVKTSVLIGCSLVVLAIVFVVGLFIGGRRAIVQLNVQMDGTQAMLAYNRISFERRLHDLLSRGCSDVALAQVKVYEDQDMQLLAGFLRGPLPTWTIKYIKQGDPHLIDELSKMKLNSTKTWTIPDCRK
jgi:hypothetical protein